MRHIVSIIIITKNNTSIADINMVKYLIEYYLAQTNSKLIIFMSEYAPYYFNNNYHQSIN